MANLNRVMLIGRLTRDAEVYDFDNGGRVANFSIAVNNRKKNAQTGEWEDDPVFVDAKLFKRGEWDRVEAFRTKVLKGNQVYVEGHLRKQSWQSREDPNVTRSKLVLYVDDFQILEAPRGQGGGGYGSDYAPPTGGYSTGGSGDYGNESDGAPAAPVQAEEPQKTYGGESPGEDPIPF